MKRPKKLAPWVLAFPEQARKLRGSVNKGRRYTKVRNAFLAAHQICAVCGKRGTKIDPLEPHHTRGRIGGLRCDARFFLAVHRQCHTWIHNNPNEARDRGLICAIGDWGRQEP